ncbi:MAG: hypothetical protein ACREF5_01845 [Candidatus Saccharimonadales bacterium]
MARMTRASKPRLIAICSIKPDDVQIASKKAMPQATAEPTRAAA